MTAVQNPLTSPWLLIAAALSLAPPRMRNLPDGVVAVHCDHFTPSHVWSCATGVADLHGWTGNRTVGTEHAAVSLLRAQHRMTVGAFEKVDACIDGHGFDGYIAALRASQLTARLHVRHHIPSGASSSVATRALTLCCDGEPHAPEPGHLCARGRAYARRETSPSRSRWCQTFATGASKGVMSDAYQQIERSVNRCADIDIC